MGDHFGKRTAWLLIYFLNYAYYDYLAQSQILGITLYFTYSMIFKDFFFTNNASLPVAFL